MIRPVIKVVKKFREVKVEVPVIDQWIKVVEKIVEVPATKVEIEIVDKIVEVIQKVEQVTV